MPLVGLPPFVVTQLLTASEITERWDWGQVALGLPEALKKTKGKGKKIAVLDTGIDRIHATTGDLKGAVLDGKDFTGSGNYWDEPSDGHGTHTASTLGARQDGKGIVGFAPECWLLIGKVLRNGTGDTRQVTAGVHWACDSGADAISMSLGSPQGDPGLAEAIERAVSEGRKVICAAGNTGRPDDVNFPARWKKPNGHPFLDNLAIAAFMWTGTEYVLAPYSSRGPEVDFAFPGTDVLGCWLDGGYSRISGTSMATPACAGTVALLLSLQEIKTHDDLRQLLRNHSKDFGETGHDVGYGWGIVKVGELIDAATIPVAPPPVSPPAADQDEIDIGSLIGFPGVKIHIPPRATDKFSVVW